MFRINNSSSFVLALLLLMLLLLLLLLLRFFLQPLLPHYIGKHRSSLYTYIFELYTSNEAEVALCIISRRKTKHASCMQHTHIYIYKNEYAYITHTHMKECICVYI